MKRTPVSLWAPLSSSELSVLRRLAARTPLLADVTPEVLVIEALALQSVVAKGLAVKPGRAQRGDEPFLTPEGLAALLDVDGLTPASPPGEVARKSPEPS
jgi:hypothetical protein